ncbi:MAG: hypothetical protein CMH64_01505 [Nanoarchaeota archaeon]|nr:hypothetical protein [Nanoarchaeota archaeon]|tara:strand:- start:6354 stop:6968 length:615 start_codon:yes stop_codon:yes gene_type:complete
MVDLITYDSLFETLQKEKTRKELQKLSPEFHKNFLKYSEEKISILNSQKSKDSIFTTEVQRTEKQVENIKRIIKDLYERRERKIVEAALFSARNPNTNSQFSSSMLKEEKQLFDEVTENLTTSRTSILHKLLEGKLPEIKSKALKTEIHQNNKVLIKFLASVPKFLGTDNFTYGPFEKEDISLIPKNISEILVTKKRARELKIK